MTEADILQQVIAARAADLSPEAARSLLSLAFDGPTSKRIRDLLRHNNRGTISAEDRVDLEKYLRVGQMLDLLHATVRTSLRETADRR